jgi:hypothetical protein
MDVGIDVLKGQCPGEGYLLPEFAAASILFTTGQEAESGASAQGHDQHFLSRLAEVNVRTGSRLCEN